MAASTRIKEIETYISDLTEKLYKADSLSENGAEATIMSYDLKLDRANLSRTLNSLWKEGKLVKIAGRPVYYLDHRFLSVKFPKNYIPTFIPMGEKITDYLDNEKNHVEIKATDGETIDDIIGAKGSLRSEIEKAKAAVCYPPNGLHTIISGNTGSGKSQLAHRMMQYAIENRNTDRKAPIFDIDCRLYSDSASKFEDLLFGSYDDSDNSKQKKGLFQKSTNGFILFEGLEALPQSSIELLGSTISRNGYINKKTGAITPVECMFIFTTNLSLDGQNALSSLINYVPISISLKDIDSKGIYEKLELILDVFSKEAKRIGLPIKVSKDALLCFCSQEYKQNIAQLQNEVKRVCSNSYMETMTSYNQLISVGLNNLPTNYLEQSNDTLHKNKSVNASMILKIIPESYILFDKNGYSESFNTFREYPIKSTSHLLSQFIDEFNVDVDSLTSIDTYVRENINCLKNCGDIQLNALKSNIDPFVYKTVINAISQIPQYSSISTHQQLLYGILIHISHSVKRSINKHNLSDNYISVVDKMYPQEYQLAQKIYHSLEDSYNFITPVKEIDFLASYLAITNQFVNKKSVGILVICHGETTATDMVNFVKKTIKKDYYIDAIDFKESMQINDYQELACLKANSLNQGSGVLVLCDMEPLTTISETIIRSTGIPSKTIYPFSLPNLLQIVERSSSSVNDLDSLTLFNDTTKNFHFIDDDDMSFVRNITDKIISKTCVFIDCYKAVDILKIALDSILSTLNIAYSNDIAVKFYCHCVAMLERTIKNESWTNSKMKRYIADHPRLMHAVEQSFESVNNSYGIKIPPAELMYVCEIFEPY